MAKLRDDFEALVEEVGRLEVDLLRVIQTNAALVEALNNTWAVLDRLTGRQPTVRQESHQHAWKVVRDAIFGHEDALLGYGVTEACPCGAVRSRMTMGRSLGDLEAA